MPATRAVDTTMLAQITRRPRAAMLSVFAISSIALWLSYTRISSSRISWLGSAAPDHQQQQEPSPKEDARIFEDIAPMEYGTAARPPLKGLKNIIGDLPKEFIPVPEAEFESSQRKKRAKRLVIVGDVHGQRTELENLLKKIEFDKTRGDHLVLAGDLVNKGRDSAGVVALAMELDAHAVRGNNEDRVLLAAAKMKIKVEAETASNSTIDNEAQAQVDEDEDQKPAVQSIKKEELDGMEEASLTKGQRSDRDTVRSLSKSQLKWLSELPVILRVGPIPASNPTIENLIVVHAGLVPGLSLKQQDPWAVMNMRSLVYPVDDLRREAVRAHLEKKAKAQNKDDWPVNIYTEQVDEELARIDASQKKHSGRKDDERDERDVALPTDTHDGILWTKEWNKAQKKLHKSKRTTVVFGHDAKTGLNVDGKYTFGLDSGCVYGRQLSALVIEAGKETVEHRIVQVECKAAK